MIVLCAAAGSALHARVARCGSRTLNTVHLPQWGSLQPPTDAPRPIMRLAAAGGSASPARIWPGSAAATATSRTARCCAAPQLLHTLAVDPGLQVGGGCTLARRHRAARLPALGATQARSAGSGLQACAGLSTRVLHKGSLQAGRAGLCMRARLRWVAGTHCGRRRCHRGERRAVQRPEEGPGDL